MLLSCDTISRILSCDTISRLLSCDTITRFISCDTISRLLSCDTISRLLSCDTISSLLSCDTIPRLLSCDTIPRLLSRDTISSLLSCDTISRLLSCDTILRLRPNKKICVFTVTCQKNLGSVGRHLVLFYLFFISKTGNSRSQFRHFIFEISGKPSFVEAVFINYDELRSFSTFFALNFDKKLTVE